MPNSLVLNVFFLEIDKGDFGKFSGLLIENNTKGLVK